MSLSLGITRARCCYRLPELPIVFGLRWIVVMFTIFLAVAVTASVLFRRAIKFAVVYVSAAVAEHPAFWACVSHIQFDRAPNNSMERTRPSRPGCNPSVIRAGSLISVVRGLRAFHSPGTCNSGFAGGPHICQTPTCSAGRAFRFSQSLAADILRNSSARL